MTKSASFASLKILFVTAVSILFAWNCRKDNPVEPPAVDSKLVGVWYNSKDTVGFEVVSDGTMKNLEVDNGGKLVYAPAQDTLVFKIESARGSAIAIRGYYKSGTVVTDSLATGTYALSNGDNTLALTFLLPFNGGSQTTFVYQRTFVGAVVVPRENYELRIRNYEEKG